MTYVLKKWLFPFRKSGVLFSFFPSPSLFSVVSCSISKAETSGFIVWTSSQFTQRLYRRNPLLREPGVQFNVRWCLKSKITMCYFITKRIHSKLAFILEIFQMQLDMCFAALSPLSFGSSHVSRRWLDLMTSSSHFRQMFLWLWFLWNWIS